MGFNKADVESLSAALGEPGWVSERRMEAWRHFEAAELPGEKAEPWRYTDLRRLKFSLDAFSPARPSASSAASEAEEVIKEEGERAAYVIQRDADVMVRAADPELARRGVIVTSLDQAVRDHGDIVKEYLFTEVDPKRDIFSALHGALFCGGTFVYVPRGVSVELPVESQRWVASGGAAVFPHNLIVLEEGAELVYIERFRSGPLDAPSLSNGALEVVCGQGSRLSFVSMQEYGQDVWHFQSQKVISERDVTLRSLVVTLGARFSRVVTESVIRGQGSTSEMVGLYFAEAGQHFDHRTLQDHAGGGSTSDLIYKGALKDASHTVFSGLIRVGEGAAKTDAYQANRNLVLSDNAKADSKPELEILNNDVRCTHGSTVGQINEDEVFYLQTRGLDRAEAERLIVNGFFEEVIQRVRNVEVKSMLHLAVERKLGE
jgi:Fe-S cluster assembly protein SufD